MKIKGLISIIIGILVLVIKGLTTTMDASGVVHEHIILIPIGYLFILAGIVIIIFGFVKKK